MIQIGRNKVGIEQWQADYIKDHWEEKTKSIAEATGLTEKKISRVAMMMELPKKAAGYNKTEGLTVGDHHYKNLTQEQLDYIMAHYEESSTVIGEKLGMNPRRVSDIILGLELRPKLHERKLPRTIEVDEELKNPYLSHVELGKKYNVDETTIAARRKELGVNVRRKNYDTEIEKQIALILDDLDLVYSTQKRIDRWSIDFYLGRKYCIDVHGTWAHSKDKVVERDERKVKFMNDNGYKYLVIEEKDLEDLDNVVLRIKDFTKGFPCQ